MSRRRYLLVVLALVGCLLSIGQISAVETRGIKVIALDKASGQKKEVKLYHKSYAVIIGIDHYKNLKYDQQLTYAVRDAKGVEQVLRKNFRFDKIITLYNEQATKASIMKVLSGELSQLSKNDAVFVFWAGHGYTEKTDFGDLGYLLPFDGNFQESELYKNISMTMIKDDISKRIPAKHIFFVMDACYSGLLVATRGASRKSARDYSYLQQITKEQVRQVLAAGSKDQQVLDGGPKGHSVFTGRFIELLENTDDFITATEISLAVKERVFSDAKARGHIQTPKYGELFGLGDYVFVPSLEQKVEDTKAKISDMEQEIKRLEELEKAAAKAEDERAKRRAESDKRVIQAKLKAEQLKQQALEDDRNKREQEEKERLKQEKQLAESKKAEDMRLALLTQEVKEKRKAMGDVSLSALSPEATITEMREIDKKIKQTKKNFRKALAEGINRIAVRINDKFVKLAQAKQDEFETEAEFNSRVDKERKTAEKEQTDEIVALERKIESEYNTQIAPFVENLKKLSENEFNLTADQLVLQLHKYDAISNTYPVTIKTKEPINGKLIEVSANIPLPRDEAREFSQHYKSNILRPQIKGYFQSINLFGVKDAVIVDDATNKNYDLFSSTFVDFGNGIIYDSVLKLLWSENVNHFRKEFYYWSDANRAASNTHIGGLSGWRTPTEKEIVRMYHLFKSNNKHPFNITKNTEFKLPDRDTSRGRVCTFGLYSYKEGKITCGDNGNWKGTAWPVRENTSEKFSARYVFFDSDYLDLGNGIVYDVAQKILWSKNANHFGKEFYYWRDAEETTNNVKIGGLSGWRTASEKELRGFYTYFKKYTVYHKDNEGFPFINITKNTEFKLPDRDTSRGRVCTFGLYSYKEGKRTCGDNGNWKGVAWPVRGMSKQIRLGSK